MAELYSYSELEDYQTNIQVIEKKILENVYEIAHLIIAYDNILYFLNNSISNYLINKMVIIS